MGELLCDAPRGTVALADGVSAADVDGETPSVREGVAEKDSEAVGEVSPPGVGAGVVDWEAPVDSV
jgi:hypothetical protein